MERRTKKKKKKRARNLTEAFKAGKVPVQQMVVPVGLEKLRGIKQNHTWWGGDFKPQGDKGSGAGLEANLCYIVRMYLTKVHKLK